MWKEYELTWINKNQAKSNKIQAISLAEMLPHVCIFGQTWHLPLTALICSGAFASEKMTILTKKAWLRELLEDPTCWHIHIFPASRKRKIPQSASKSMLRWRSGGLVPKSKPFPQASYVISSYYLPYHQGYLLILFARVWEWGAHLSGYLRFFSNTGLKFARGGGRAAHKLHRHWGQEHRTQGPALTECFADSESLKIMMIYIIIVIGSLELDCPWTFFWKEVWLMVMIYFCGDSAIIITQIENEARPKPVASPDAEPGMAVIWCHSRCQSIMRVEHHFCIFLYLFVSMCKKGIDGKIAMPSWQLSPPLVQTSVSSKKRQVMHTMGRPKPELMVDVTVVLQLNQMLIWQGSFNYPFLWKSNLMFKCILGKFNGVFPLS